MKIFIEIVTIFILNFLMFGYSLPLNEKDAKIVWYENNNDGLGTYSFQFETSDGTLRSEEGYIENAENPEKASLVVRGTYNYVGPDGIYYSVSYTADENGFRPEGDHIPQIPGTVTTPPPFVAAAPPPGSGTITDIAADVLGSLLGTDEQKRGGVNIPLGLKK